MSVEGVTIEMGMTWGRGSERMREDVKDSSVLKK